MAAFTSISWPYATTTTVVPYDHTSTALYRPPPDFSFAWVDPKFYAKDGSAYATKKARDIRNNVLYERELWVRKTYFNREPRLTKHRRFLLTSSAPSRCQKAREKRKMRLQSY